MKFVVGENVRNPREKPTQTPFRPPQNPHGVTETRTRDPSGGRQAPNRLCHKAAHACIGPTFYDKILSQKLGWDLYTEQRGGGHILGKQVLLPESYTGKLLINVTILVTGLARSIKPL